jgi:hypothetical protein
MQNWLHEEVFNRLRNQAGFLMGDRQQALVLGLSGFRPAVDELAKQVTTMEYAQLGEQTPGPQYDCVFVHLLPNDPEHQLLIWQQLSCLAKEGAALFFSAWSVDTFKQWRGQLPLEFQDMHNIGDGLAQAGWTDAVMSSQHMEVTYEDPEGLKHDAEIVGLAAANPETPATITYEMAFGHAVFSRKLRSRQMGEYEVEFG